MRVRLLILVPAVVLGSFYLGIASKKIFSPSFEEQARILKSQAQDWITSSLKDDGLFVYSFNPQTGEYSQSNNEIRQLMPSRLLAQLSQTDPSLLPLHERNLAAWIDNWYQEKDGIGYILYAGESKLGANAMLLRTLIASPFFEAYADKAEALARGILKLQNKDGSLEAWYIEPEYTDDREYLLTYYTGEALTALTEYYKKISNAVYLSAAVKSARFYIDEYVVHLQDNYYPNYVPWHTIAYANLYKMTAEKSYADAIFTLNDKLLEIQDTTGYIGRFFDSDRPEYGLPHSASDGVYTEGLVYAYEIAKEVGEMSHARRYLEAIKLSVKNLYGLQYRRPLTRSPLPFDVYRGSIRTNAENMWVRIDNAQHAVDALTHLENLQ